MPGGRPTLYNPQRTPVRARLLASKGCTNEEIARGLGVGVSTLYDWQAEYPEFAEAIRTAKRGPDEEVEAAVLKAAKGYEYLEQSIKVDYIDGRPTNRITGMVRRHVPPNTTLAIFWLKNRMPGRWKDVRQIEQRIDGRVVLELERLSDDELEQYIRLTEKAEEAARLRLTDGVEDVEPREAVAELAVDPGGG